MASIPDLEPMDALAWFGHNVIVDYHEHHEQIGRNVTVEYHGQSGRAPGMDIPPIQSTPHPRLPFTRSEEPIGIIGAGVGGLYAAMLLRSVDIPFKIIEASDRVGGRLFTHHFNKNLPYDYYDVGAMRFPVTPVMDRTTKLFQKLDLPLLEYTFKDPNTILMYNGVRQPQHRDDGSPEPWNLHPRHSWRKLVDNAVQPFAKRIVQDVRDRTRDGWKFLMKYDMYSTRAYMSGNRSDAKPELDELKQMPYHTTLVNWLETWDTSTGSYEHAFSEKVMDAVAFHFPGKEPAKWKCIDGGSSKITNGMIDQLKCTSKELSLNSSVVSIRSKPNMQRVEVEFETANGRLTKSFPHVITTTTLSCLQTVDTDGAGLDPDQTSALRQLAYGSAVKIGVKFKSNWWEQANRMPFGAIHGGQSSTDRMVRTVVYPSYGATERSNVLIVSYTWSADAVRWGAILNDKARVKDIVLRDLAALHNVELFFLKEQWVDHHAFSWVNDPYTMGAYAAFGPGQFSSILKNLTRPAAHGRLHFAGEAISTHHAWVVGALEASYRAVKTIILTSHRDKYQKFVDIWGEDDTWSEKALLKQFVISCPDWEVSLKA